MFLSHLLSFPTAAQESAAPPNGDLPAPHAAPPSPMLPRLQGGKAKRGPPVSEKATHCGGWRLLTGPSYPEDAVGGAPSVLSCWDRGCHWKVGSHRGAGGSPSS